MKTSHSVTLSGLTPGTTYHYRVNSHDAANNLASLADATFTTAGDQNKSGGGGAITGSGSQMSKGGSGSIGGDTSASDGSSTSNVSSHIPTTSNSNAYTTRVMLSQ